MHYYNRNLFEFLNDEEEEEGESVEEVQYVIDHFFEDNGITPPSQLNNVSPIKDRGLLNKIDPVSLDKIRLHIPILNSGVVYSAGFMSTSFFTPDCPLTFLFRLKYVKGRMEFFLRFQDMPKKE